MKTICLDFDGVIHLNLVYVSPLVINGKLIDGAADAIKQFRLRSRVVVYSCRCNAEGGADAIKVWLSDRGIEVDDVVNRKPLADVYVDDRGIPFNGNWIETVRVIEGFRPWYSGIKAAHADLRRRLKR